MQKAVVIGAGLGGLATSLRLQKAGYEVLVLEKHSTAGGRLNQLRLDGFTFDLGPTFMSMTYELGEFFDSIEADMPVELIPLDPLYQVFFEGREKPFRIYKDLNRLGEEFGEVETDFARKAGPYLQRASRFFFDTENTVIRQNFDGILDYVLKLRRVPKKHLPYLFRNMWSEVSRTFSSNEVRIIFSLVAFFLGDTPFKTPSIYSLLNFTELKHNGYWRIKGGMYRLVEELLALMQKRGISIVLDTEVKSVIHKDGRISGVVDQNGHIFEADLFVSNSDAASFRNTVLHRKGFETERLDAMHWTLAPFTVYLGIRGKAHSLMHHNYFLGNNFKGYASKIFTTSVSPQKPYYYVNVPSRTEAGAAPEGCEALFILCPVPDLRYKSDWSDKDELADNIISDLSVRSGCNIKDNVVARKVLTPIDWQNYFNLYRGSGLGLAHSMLQVGAFRPKNKDEVFRNLYYVGASTTPGTGLPMVIISSKLTTARIKDEHSAI